MSDDTYEKRAAARQQAVSPRPVGTRRVGFRLYFQNRSHACGTDNDENRAA